MSDPTDLPEDFDEFGFCHLCFLSKEHAQLVRVHWTALSQPSRLVLAVPLTNNDFCLCMNCIRGIKRLPFSLLPAPIAPKPISEDDSPF